MQYRMQILTSHEIQFFSCKPIACAPLEMSGIQKALTQLKGSITDHLEDNHRSIYQIAHNKEGFDINTSWLHALQGIMFNLSRELKHKL